MRLAHAQRSVRPIPMILVSALALGVFGCAKAGALEDELGGAGSSGRRGTGGAGWGGVEARAGMPLETLGVPSAGHAPLALTGPRGISIAASLHEGRHRFGQIVEPGTQGLAGGGLRPGAGVMAVVVQPAYLAAHGPFAVRAPPTGTA